MNQTARSVMSVVCLAGCVDVHHGSTVVANFENLGPPSAVIIAGAAPLQQPHYQMWATIREDSVVDVFSFDIAPVVDIHSPCLMYDENAAQAYGGSVQPGEPVMAPLPDCRVETCTAADYNKAWIQNRARVLYESVFAITSVSDGFPGGTMLDLGRCRDQQGGATFCWLDHAAIVRSTFALTHEQTALALDVACGDGAPIDAMHFCLEPSSGRVTISSSIKSGRFAASYRAHLQSGNPRTDPLEWSNEQRLRMCAQPMSDQPSNPCYDPTFYVGNVLQMTAPRSGVFYGVVDALDPNAGFQLGGIQADAQFNLAQATEIFVTVEDRNAGLPDRAIGNLVDVTNRGPTVLRGYTMTDDPSAGRGVLTVNLSAPANVSFGAPAGDPTARTPGGHASIYVDLDDDPLQF